MPHILHGKKSSVGCAIWPSISNQLGNNSLFDMYGGPEKGLLVGEIEERLRPSSRRCQEAPQVQARYRGPP